MRSLEHSAYRLRSEPLHHYRQAHERKGKMDRTHEWPFCVCSAACPPTQTHSDRHRICTNSPLSPFSIQMRPHLAGGLVKWGKCCKIRMPREREIEINSPRRREHVCVRNSQKCTREGWSLRRRLGARAGSLFLVLSGFRWKFVWMMQKLLNCNMKRALVSQQLFRGIFDFQAKWIGNLC